MDQFVVIPSPRGDGFVELSRTQQGRVFRKHMLNYGDLLYPDAPGGKVHIDEKFADTLIANFTAGVVPIVQVPKVGSRNEHTEDPDRNIGEVIRVYKGAKGVYADIDVRTDDADKVGKTLLGASAMLHLNYTDTATNQRVGPTLLHAAITNRPYITNLERFEEVIAASNAGADNLNQVLVLTPADNEENPMTLEEMLAALKDDHGIDVAALQDTAARSVALSNKIQEELVGTGLLTLSNSGDPVDADTLIGAVAEAGNQIVALSARVDDLVQAGAVTAAEARVDKLVLSGHILPKKREAHVKLLLSDPNTFEEIVPEQPIVKLSREDGIEPPDGAHDETVTAEIDRLTKVAEDNGISVRR